MTDEDKKEQLVGLLERRVFQPVLSITPDDFDAPNDREMLEDLQDNLRAERQRFREEYGSPEEVREAFHDDVSSEEGQELERECHMLGLPFLTDVEQEFDDLCEKLGIAGW
jgi:hypothetical protein